MRNLGNWLTWLVAACLALHCAGQPTLQSVTLTYSQPRVNTLFACSTVGFDPSSPVTPHYLWLRNGATYTDSSWGSSPPGSLTTDTAKGWAFGNTIQCFAWLTNSNQEQSSTIGSAIVTIQDTPPSLQSVKVWPKHPRRNDVINCTAGAVIDPDTPNGPFIFKYTWLRNGAPIPGQATPYLVPNNFARGDYIACTALANDGTLDGSGVTATAVLVVDTPPVLQTAQLSPSLNVKRTDLLVCVPGTVFDADGDTNITYSFIWVRNGAVMRGFSGPSLAPFTLTRGDVVLCEARPYDNIIWGSYVNSSIVVIVDSPPVVTAAKFSPAHPRRTDNITCIPTAVFSADGDTTFTFQFAWFINGNAQPIASNVSMLPARFLVKNDFVVCQIRAYDGIAWGSYSQPFNVTVANSPPVIAVFSPTPDDMANPTTISCVPSSVSDPDGDTVAASTYRYLWFVNGVQQAGATAATFAAFARFNSIQCQLSVSDNDATHPLTTSQMSLVLLIDSPVISTLVASDPSNVDLIFTNGDAITLTFNEGTDRGVGSPPNPSLGTSILNKARVDQTIHFSQTLGTDYQGQWLDDSTLQITILDARAASPPGIGVMTAIALTTGQVRNQAQTSLYAAQWSQSPALSGTWGNAAAAFVMGDVAIGAGPSVPTDTHGDLIGSTAPRPLPASSFGGSAVLTACAGARHAMAVANQVLYAAGDNSLGQLGLSSTATNSVANYAVDQTVPTFTVVDTLGVSVTGVACGGQHSLAISTAGAAYACGLSTYGQLGVAPTSASNSQSSFAAVSIALSAGETITSVAAGELSSFFVTSAGRVFACGQHFGSSYDSSNLFGTAALVSGLSSLTITAAAAGYDHALLLDSNGVVYAWGRNQESQCGKAITTATVASPQPVAGLSGVVGIAISAGGFHSLVLANDGSVWCFGLNSDSQCGVSSGRSTLPVKLGASAFGGTFATAIAGGSTHSLVSNTKGQVWSMGFNIYAALGLTSQYTSVPTLVAAVTSDITQVFTHTEVSLAVTRSSIVNCPYGCSGNGGCFQGVCVCATNNGQPLWSGNACQTPVCPVDALGRTCSGNSTGCAVDANGVPQCICNTRFTGALCDKANCSSPALGNNCNGNGVCTFGVNLQPVCSCNEGWSGASCSTCAFAFGPRGVCNVIDCGALNNCTYRGNCTWSARQRNVVCSCNHGWTGAQCTKLACPAQCSGNGDCVSDASSNFQPTCRCYSQWSGSICANETCLGTPACSGHGTCGTVSGQPTCQCDNNWSLQDCSQPLCTTLSGCSGHGVCVGSGSGTACSCDNGYSGADCSQTSSVRSSVLIGLIVGVVVVGVVVGGFVCFGLYKRHHRATVAIGGSGFTNIQKRKKAFQGVSGVGV